MASGANGLDVDGTVGLKFGEQFTCFGKSGFDRLLSCYL